MIPLQNEEIVRCLVEQKAASRVAAKDGTLYDFGPGVAAAAGEYLGWSTLASQPPVPIERITMLADHIRADGLEAVVLIGQGGSTQASMTVTKLNALDGVEIPFRTMDSLSPVYVNHILGSSDPAHTLYIVSSKSGSTLEPTVLARVAWQYVCAHLGEQRAGSRFVAITDPGSLLEQDALGKRFRDILPGSPDVGGRYSALSVFALFPMALVGIDLEAAMELARATEARCASDDEDNPAIRLAAFLYGNYCAGRDKFSLVMPPSGQVFGLWLEQLVAESLGKNGKGILPNVEVDAGILAVPHADRSVITYAAGNDEGFSQAVSCIDASIPQLNLAVNSALDVIEHFIIWEYAVAFCGLLIQENPFDQPDVESTKRAVKGILYGKGMPLDAANDLTRVSFDGSDGILELAVTDRIVCGEVSGILSVDEALRQLLCSIGEGDYFSLNAFLPFYGIGRREALERIRHRVAERLGVVSCLEIGPRYLHSTGQLHKGGPDTGVYLILSADELFDAHIPGEKFTLGELAKAQAEGDFATLAGRGRRGVHLHLVDNDSETLSRLADRVCAAVSAAQAQRKNLR
jgi:glucose-6-phosphate isomerase